MEFILFEDYIPLQALLKKVGLTQSGGSIKELIAQNAIYYNGTVETRRRKKVFIGDYVTIPEQGITIKIIAPTKEEQLNYISEQKEKARVQEKVKLLNNQLKQQKKITEKREAPVRFPGT